MGSQPQILSMGNQTQILIMKWPESQEHEVQLLIHWARVASPKYWLRVTSPIQDSEMVWEPGACNQTIELLRMGSQSQILSMGNQPQILILKWPESQEYAVQLLNFWAKVASPIYWARVTSLYKIQKRLESQEYLVKQLNYGEWVVSPDIEHG